MPTRLVVFDLDGTLIRGSTCCELIAAKIGRLDETRRFERCVTQADIASARLEMARWYSRYAQEELLSSLAAAVEAPGLRNGIDKLREAGVSVGIASITWTFAVRWFAERFAARFYLGTELRPDGTIIHVWPDDKAQWMRQTASGLGITMGETAAVGDSASDFPMMLAAGRGFYVGTDRPSNPKLRHFPAGDIEEIVNEAASTLLILTERASDVARARTR